jgi:hypothetical protein
LTVGVINGRLYAIGGYHGITGLPTNLVEVYDPVSDSWTTAAPMPTERAELTSATANGLIHVFGGYNGGLLTTQEAFHNSAIPAPAGSLSALAYDGEVLYAGFASSPCGIFKLDPMTGAVLETIPSPTCQPRGMASDGAGHLFLSSLGNFDPGGDVFELDASGNILNSFLVPFRAHSVAFDGTNLYIGDTDSGQIRVTDRVGNHIRTFDAGFRPAGLVFDSRTGHLWAVSMFDRSVREITTEGSLVRTCASPRAPGVQGIGSITRVGSRLYLGEAEPDPFHLPNEGGTIFAVEPVSLLCNPPIPLNEDPVANAGPDRIVIAGESVQFDGTASSDDGTIESFDWDFADGGTANGAIVNHVFLTAGTFQVTLTVTDDAGATGTDTSQITVQSPAQAIQSLSALVQSFNLQQGIANSLDKKLENARAALDAANAGQRSDALNKLQAFINSVEAQRGSELTDAQADALVASARRIMAVL